MSTSVLRDSAKEFAKQIIFVMRDVKYNKKRVF